MIPDFNTEGNLPAGVHLATLEEVAERFGAKPELRRTQMESVRWMVKLATQAGIERIVLNGSFVTNILEPNDVDCVLLAGEGYDDDGIPAARLADGLPFLHIQIVNQNDFDLLVKKLFARARVGAEKGMVEVLC